MRSLLVALLVGMATARAAHASEVLDPAKTYVVIAGVVTWADSTMPAFEAAGRKDIELYNTFAERGVPADQRVLLTDAHATTANITAAVSAMVAAAPADATLVFYYEGHGMQFDDGDIAFASYDVTADDPWGTALTMPDLEAAFAPAVAHTTLLFGDACYSGALAKVARSISQHGGRTAVALTSATATIESTGNWTFTQALIDGLRGRALVDLNDDGIVDLGELARDTANTMKHREAQRRGYVQYGVSERLVLAATELERDPLGTGAGRLKKRGWVTATDPDDYEAVAQILGVRDDGMLRVAFYDYATERQEWRSPDDVTPLR